MVNCEMVGERIESLIKKAGITKKKLIADMGLGVNALSEFKKGKAMSFITLVRIAEYFGCTTDYLFCLSDDEKVILPDDEKILLDRYRQLDSLGQEIVRAKAGELLQNLQRGTGDLASEGQEGYSAHAG